MNYKVFAALLSWVLNTGNGILGSVSVQILEIGDKLIEAAKTFMITYRKKSYLKILKVLFDIKF
jgi:hypothetical protein